MNEFVVEIYQFDHSLNDARIRVIKISTFSKKIPDSFPPFTRALLLRRRLIVSNVSNPLLSLSLSLSLFFTLSLSSSVDACQTIINNLSP